MSDNTDIDTLRKQLERMTFRYKWLIENLKIIRDVATSFNSDAAALLERVATTVPDDGDSDGEMQAAVAATAPGFIVQVLAQRAIEMWGDEPK